MAIIIGRNQQTRQLAIIKGGQTVLFGQPGSVPMDVSRQHLSLQQLGNGNWQIKNLNDNNVTFVNGLSVESKTVSESDKVELGNSHYLLNWSALQEPKVETVDIKRLKKVWEDFNSANIEIQKRQKNIGLLASIPVGITMIGGLIAGLASEEVKPYAYVFTAIALVVMFYGWYKKFTDKSIEEREALKKSFQNKYVCPKCGRFMGFQDYDILVQNDACPYCKTKYKK